MASDIKIDLDRLADELTKRSPLNRLLNEEQADISKYLTGFVEAVKKATGELGEAAAALEKTTKEVENRQAEDIKLYEEFKDKFQTIMKLTDEGELEKGFQGLIDSIKISIKELEAEDVEKKKSLELIKDSLEAQKKFNEAQREVTLAEMAKLKEERLLNRLKSSASSNVGKIFGSMGISFKGDPADMNPLFMGLDLIRNNQVQEGIRTLSTYAELTAIAYRNMLDPLNIFVNMLSQVKTQMLAVFMQADSVTAEFKRTTGATGAFSEIITDTWDTTRAFNLSLQDMSETVKGLMSNYAGFTLKSRESQENITIFSSLVSRLGVGATTTAKAFAYFSDTLKLSDASAKAAFSSILGLSKTTGETLEKVTTAFISSLPVLARYGAQAKEVFKQVFATAKALRIETKELLDITSKFDTFEDAAASVGKLNAIMGGPYLNAIQLMNQNEAERIVTLNQSFKATGKNWEALGKYGRMALATAAGITDMDLAQRVFTGSTADASRLMRQASMDQEELSKKNKEATTIADAFKNVLMQLGKVFMPVIDAVRWLVGGIASIADALGDFSFIGIPALFMLGGAILGVKKGLVSLAQTIATKVAGGLGKLISLGGKSKEVLDKGADVIKNVGKAGVGAAPGIGLFAGALKALSAPGVALGILKVGLAIGAVIASFMAMKDFAVGIGGVFKGVGKFIEGIGQGFFDWVTESPLEELEDLINTLKDAGPDIGSKMMGIGSGLKEMVESFNNTISHSTIKSFTDLIEVLSENSDKFSTSIGTGILDSYSRLMEASSDLVITPTKINDMKQFTENLVTLSKASGDGGLGEIGKLAAASNNQNIEVKVYIDGTEMKEKLVKVMKTELGNSLQPRT